jgi:hypothetical protein
MPDARCTRDLVRKGERGCAHEPTGSAEASGIPCVMALRLMPRSPRRPGFVVTVTSRTLARNLTPASGRQDHTVLPYAQTSFVLRAFPSLTRFNPRCDIHGVPTFSRPPHPVPRS